jgi:hypothetical protein
LYNLSIVIVPLVIAGALVLMLLPSGGDRGADRPPRGLTGHERKAQRLERRAAAHPGDERLSARAIRTWNRAGGQWLLERDFGDSRIPPAVREDFRHSVGVWDRYLARTGDDANPDIAETAAEIYMQLAEIGSRDPERVERDVAGAARASEIAGRGKPILYTLSNTAIYAYFNGETRRGEVAADGAAADAGDNKQLRTIAIDQLNGYQERGETFRRLLREAKDEMEESGDDLLDEPLKAYVHQVGLNKEDPSEEAE